MSNFDFLKEFDSTLWKLGNRIEKNVSVSPSGVKADATTFLEHILKKLLTMAGLKYNSRKPFTDQVDAVFRSNLKMSNAYRERIKSAYNYRNKIHDEFADIEKHEFQDAINLHEKLFYIARKFYRDYNEDYDEYKGVPDFKPLQIDLTEDEIKNRDFNEIIDVKFDYCIVCGEPNHLNYSIYCHKCSRKLDNANNFISIRNAFGKDAKFTKEDLIEYGMPEGYVNQFLNSLVRENMLKAAGRFYTFNNMYLDEYLKRIDNYISVGELITRFKEDKISPLDIKKSREYTLGSKKQNPFYQFYKIVNREIVKKFEKDLPNTCDVKKSIDYTTISDKQIIRWYNIQLTNYKKGEFNEAFLLFNELLIKEYLKLKSEGILEGEIRKSLNVTDRMYDFWRQFDTHFEDRLKEIKIDLLTKAIMEGKTREEVIASAGVTSREYDDLVKVSDFNKNEFSKLRNEEIRSRKREFVRYFNNFDLKIACRKAKLTVDDFYRYYENDDVTSEFYVKSTRIFMKKYLYQRKLGRTKKEAMDNVGIREEYLNRWLSRSKYSEFKDDDLKVTVELILKGFKQKKELKEIADTAGVTVNAIKSYIKLGERGSEIYKPLFDYYEEKIVPEKIAKFLSGNGNKPIAKSLEHADLTFEELNKYYELGKSGDRRFEEFYNDFHEIKLAIYTDLYSKGKSHKIAMRESHLSPEEYEESRDKIDDSVRKFKFIQVIETIRENKTSNVAAKRAGCSVEEIYDWYFKGRDGDEDYREFYKAFHKLYVNASVVPMQEKIDDENAKLSVLIKSNRDKFTKKDVEIWVKHGLIDPKVNINSKKQDEDDDEEEDSKTITLSNVKSTSNRSSLGRVIDADYDVEELKKEILKKQ